ncbi:MULTISPECIES: hypothetical protein [unclassified Pseudoalteromonas]|uniref:hypothetical protein n=1 Tax=unclassified Pseudoalteromonas TaxID=194690 RepID=UPI0016040AEE|nr:MULTISPECIES: hypothetical protein [unclassified Pseudoalteromonas]MBB1295169.1 hypothetical protein [Pseudoalteromonas sp. SR41-4]MBB1410272.1 hypothetical protein [Pseudoalteromonas sp. SG44-17]
MQTHAKKNKVNHLDKIECVYRIQNHGSTIKACAKRFGVTDKKVISWLSMHEKGELIKQHAQWSPSWNKENVIQHPLDLDILQAIKRGNPTYEDSIISLFDPELDAVNCISHVEWQDEEIEKLCLWMVDRSLEILRDVAVDSEDLIVELEFVSSNYFALICKAFGFDHVELRKGIYHELRLRGVNRFALEMLEISSVYTRSGVTYVPKSEY